MKLRRTRFELEPCWRLIPTRIPSVRVFDRLAKDDEENVILEALEIKSNPRIQRFGEEDAYVMAPFAYPNPDGSRFSDGTYGVWYGGLDQDTCLAEVAHHTARRMRYTSESPILLQFRMLRAEIQGDLVDIRQHPKDLAKVYSPTSYQASQIFAKPLWVGGESGLAYDSVRHSGGGCVALFKPEAIRNCRHALHVHLQWDGDVIHI